MPDKIRHYTIFIESKTQRIILTKVNYNFYYSSPSNDIIALKWPSVNEISELKKISKNVLKVTNDGKIVSTQQKRPLRYDYLSSKINTYCLIETQIKIILADIHKNFSPQEILSRPIKSELVKKYRQFMLEEKKITLSKVYKFKRNFKLDLNRCKTKLEILKLYDKLRMNLNLGVYSVMNRERKQIGIQQN